MPCYRPLTAYKTATGGVVFSELKRHDIRKSLDLPCGQCVGCRLDTSVDWATRCTHEMQLHDENTFITLTYNKESLPPGGSLHYPHYQTFMKDLRETEAIRDEHNNRWFKKISFFMSGEYGELNLRPHYHAILFGHEFKDKIALQKTSEGHQLWTSKQLEQLWPYGHVSIGEANFETAAYVARYIMKKINGTRLITGWHHYTRIDDNGEIWEVQPEFAHMSLNPAIGKRWLKKFHTDVYPNGKVVINGTERNAPKYYDKLFKKKNEEQHEQLMYEREQEARKRAKDNTNERLKVREIVANAQVNQLKRKL